jgi:hypothetical protein
MNTINYFDFTTAENSLLSYSGIVLEEYRLMSEDNTTQRMRIRR